MSEIDKEKDIEQLMYRELPPDRYCYIHNYIVDLQNKLQQKENIIKEVREYILKNIDNTGWLEIGSNEVKELLEILQGSDKE